MYLNWICSHTLYRLQHAFSVISNYKCCMKKHTGRLEVLCFIQMVTSHKVLLRNRTCTKLIIGYDNKTNVLYELNFLAYKLVTWTEYITAQHVLLWGQSHHLIKYIISCIRVVSWISVGSRFDDWIYYTFLL
jgi:hypothetical protein